MGNENQYALNSQAKNSESRDSFENIKKNLKNILLSKYFCGLCIEICQEWETVDVELEVSALHQALTPKDLVANVFNNENVLRSDYICSNCIDNLMKSFFFITNMKVRCEVLNIYLDNLSDKIETCFSENLQNLDCSNIALFLESTDIEHYFPEKFKDKKLSKSPKPPTNMKIRSYICYKCCEIFPTNKELQQHKMICHTTANYVCDYCSKEFKNEDKLSVHYKTHFAVKCKICPEVVPENDINGHLKNNHEDLVYECDDCDNIFYSERALETHRTIVHKKNVDCQCPLCLKSLKENEIENHKCRFTCPQCNVAHCRHYDFLMSYRNQKLKGVSVKCINCDFVCHKRETLLVHVNKEHLNYSPFCCKKCGMHFYSRVDLNGHLRYHKGEYDCKYCDEEMNDTEELKEHMQLCQKLKREHTCKECDASFYTKDELNTHSNKHIPLHECEKCKKKFIYKSRLKYHIIKAHSKDQLTTTRDSTSEKVAQGSVNQKTWICETCGKIFNTVDALKSHCRLHAAKIPCPECKKFVIPLKMPAHRRLHLYGKDPTVKPPYKKTAKVKCQYCVYVTFDKVMLEGHINRYHNKIKPYTCTVCGKNFIGRLHLKRHMDCHVNNKSMTCEICNKVLANKNCLTMHMRLHTGERPYTCHICGDKFRSSSIMNFHKNRVHAEKSIECPLCGSMFYSLIELRRHVRKVHWKRKEKFNYRELEGLGKEHYYLFHDGRTPSLESEN